MNLFNIQPLKETNHPLIPFTPRLGPFKVIIIQVVNPQAGLKSYYWCSCGMSSNQPFCNRMHNGTGFVPIKFSLDEYREEIFLCGCKRSKLSPFCDGETCLNRQMSNQKLNNQNKNSSENDKKANEKNSTKENVI